MTRGVPICFDCRHLDLRADDGRTFHWCSKKKKRLAEPKITRKACKHFKPWPPYEEAPWP